jgi:hypothetical protein
VTDFLLRQAQASRAGAQGNSLIGCMKAAVKRSASSKFQSRQDFCRQPNYRSMR